MKPIIEKLWSSSVLSEQNHGADVPEIGELAGLMERNREELKATLNEQELQLLEKYIDCEQEYIYYVEGQAFHDGFSLASKLLLEALG